MILSFVLAVVQLIIWMKKMEVHSHLSTRWARLGSVLLLIIPLFVGIFFPTVTLDSTTVSAKGFHFPLAEGTSTAIQQDEGTTSQYLKPDTSTYFTKGAYEKEMRAAGWDVHDGALVMLGIKLRETCTILDKPLKDISGPEDPYHVVAIKRDGDTIIPGGNDVLKRYDMAYFMTTRQYIPFIRKIVGKEHYVDVKHVMMMGGGRTAVRAVKTIKRKAIWFTERR